MPHEIKSLCRRLAGCNKYDNVPVVMVAGSQEPTMQGSSYYHTTLSGRTIVRHPSAYGYPTLYHPSTRHIVVGADYINSL